MKSKDIYISQHFIAFYLLTAWIDVWGQMWHKANLKKHCLQTLLFQEEDTKHT